MKKFNLALIDSSGTKINKFEINLLESSFRCNTEQNQTKDTKYNTKPIMFNKSKLKQVQKISSSFEIRNSLEVNIPKHSRTNSAKEQRKNNPKNSPIKVTTPKFKKFPNRMGNNNNPPLVPKLNLVKEIQQENKLNKNRLEFTFNSSLMKSESEKKLFPYVFTNSIKHKHNTLINNLRPVDNKPKITIKAKLINFQNLKRLRIKLHQKDCLASINESTVVKKDKSPDERNEAFNKNPSITSNSKADNTFKRPPSIKTSYSTDKLKVPYRSKPIQKSFCAILSPSDGEHNDSTVFSSNRQNNSNGGSLRGTPKIIKNHPHIRKFFDS